MSDSKIKIFEGYGQSIADNINKFITNPDIEFVDLKYQAEHIQDTNGDWVYSVLVIYKNISGFK
ncbi:MAG: sporulation protein Cse60 [Nitrosarchaeum sp.]|nr:sporulation protein Cse60 [Nitrosarchaeum sp.]